MKKTILSSIFMSALFGICSAHAQLAVVNKPIGFSGAMTSIPANGQMFFAYDLKSSNDWGPEIAAKSEIFPGFKSFESWMVSEDTNETVIYKSETSVVVDKSLSAIDLKKLESVELMNSVDPAFKHQEVTADQVNQAYAKEINDGFLSAKEVLGSRLNRRKLTNDEYQTQLARAEAQLQKNLNVSWCQSGSKCVLSKAAFPDTLTFSALIAGANAMGMNVPSSLDIYTQITPMSAEQAAQLGASAGVTQLGVVANKFVISMKNVILLKEIAPNQTLMTIQVTAVLEKDDLDKLSLLGSYDTLIGMGAANQDTGILMGLPALNQKLAEGLKSAL